MEPTETSVFPGQQIRGDERQVRNSAGGYVFKIDDIERLKRFLVLGSAGGTYYANERELGKENVACIFSLINSGRGKEVVDIIKTFSIEGRCPKQLTIVYALACCARYHDGDHSQRYLETRRAAYEALVDICRIPTDLFHFVAYCKEISKSNEKRPGTGWGKAHRKAIGKWYLSQDAEKLAYLVTKYKQRDGWSHKDLLRLSHTKANADQKSHQIVFKYIAKGFEECVNYYSNKDDFPSYTQLQSNTFAKLEAVASASRVDQEDLTETEKEEKIISLIKKHDLVREHLPTQFLKSLKVWYQLLFKMPMTALIRNLGKMSSDGMFEDKENHNGKEIAIRICDWLVDEERLKKARIHPFNVLLALKTYETGKGEKSEKTWNVNKNITEALEKAFYKSFKFVEPTNKRYLLGIDVSGSMSYNGCNGCTMINPAEASAAMAMVALKTEPEAYPMAFSSELVPLQINSDMKLAEVLKETRKLMFGATDCAQPMIYALENRISVDVFIVYTDNESWFGKVHPHQALLNYRREMNIPDAKLIVCAMTSSGFSIADPDDALMLDIVGFDSVAPQVIAEFASLTYN